MEKDEDMESLLKDEDFSTAEAKNVAGIASGSEVGDKVKEVDREKLYAKLTEKVEAHNFPPQKNNYSILNSSQIRAQCETVMPSNECAEKGGRVKVCSIKKMRQRRRLGHVTK